MILIKSDGENGEAIRAIIKDFYNGLIPASQMYVKIYVIVAEEAIKEFNSMLTHK